MPGEWDSLLLLLVDLDFVELGLVRKRNARYFDRGSDFSRELALTQLLARLPLLYVDICRSFLGLVVAPESKRAVKRRVIIEAPPYPPSWVGCFSVSLRLGALTLGNFELACFARFLCLGGWCGVCAGRRRGHRTALLQAGRARRPKNFALLNQEGTRTFRRYPQRTCRRTVAAKPGISF